jgi:hypothetical protein
MSWPVLVKMKIAVADALNASAGLRFRSSPVEEGWGNSVAGWQHTRVRLGRLRTSMATPDAELRGESI